MKIGWKQKAFVQRLVARLPERSSYAAYLFLQRRAGALRRTNPMEGLRAGIKIVGYIAGQGQSAASKSFLEIGTGWRLNNPISLWLCGASKVVTIDVNPYLNEQLVLADIAYMRDHQEEVRSLFKDSTPGLLHEDRFDRLLNSCDSLEKLLATANIEYVPRADPGHLRLPSHSVDYHISYSVLEYIPDAALRACLAEGRRIVKANGLLVHFLDLTDNFAHTDHSIHNLNFLQFSESEWLRIAGNRFMYHSRLRIDDYLTLMKQLHLGIAVSDATVDEDLVKIIEGGFPIDARFKSKDVRTNATVEAWIVATVEEPGN